jgi:hypothetical protein
MFLVCGPLPYPPPEYRGRGKEGEYKERGKERQLRREV